MRVQKGALSATSHLTYAQQPQHALWPPDPVGPQPTSFEVEPLDDASLSGAPCDNLDGGLPCTSFSLDLADVTPLGGAGPHAPSEDDYASLTEVAEPSEPASPAPTEVGSMASADVWREEAEALGGLANPGSDPSPEALASAPSPLRREAGGQAPLSGDPHPSLTGSLLASLQPVSTDDPEAPDQLDYGSLFSATFAELHPPGRRGRISNKEALSRRSDASMLSLLRRGLE